jgi:predicted N-formylglutamate amidohydrolase
VVDCNRVPGAVDAVAAISDGTAIPGNFDEADRALRYSAVFDPYHEAIGELLAARDAAGTATAVVSLHSFTPSFGGIARPWPIGVLHDRGDTRFAQAVLDQLRENSAGPIGDNAPYRMDGTDYTVPRHAYPGRPYVELEVRQDLLATPHACKGMADLLAQVLTAAWSELGG